MADDVIGVRGRRCPCEQWCCPRAESRLTNNMNGECFWLWIYFALRPPTDKMFGPLGHRGRPAGRVRSVVGSAANRRSGSVPGPRDGTVRRPRRGRSLVARAWAPNWVTIECAWKNRSVLVSDPWPLMIFHLIRLLVVGCTYFGQFPLFAISDLPCNDWPNIGN